MYIIACSIVLFLLYHLLVPLSVFFYIITCPFVPLSHCPFSFISLVVPLSFFFYIIACPIVLFLLYHYLFLCPFSFISLLVPLSFFFYIIGGSIALFLLYHCLSHCPFSFISLLVPLSHCPFSFISLLVPERERERERERFLSDSVCFYTYEFWLSPCKIARSSVILLLPLFKIIIGKQKVHRKVSVFTMEVVKFIKTYCQNMACDAL